MALQLPFGIQVNNSLPLDAYYYDGDAAWTSTTAANAGINVGVRYEGLTVNVNGEEYWFYGGTADINLVTKLSGTTDHGALTGLTDDDHPQYALLAGRNNSDVLVIDEIDGYTNAASIDLAGISITASTIPWANIDSPTTVAGYGMTDFNTTVNALATAQITADVDKAFVDALNVDADTLDSLDSTAFILQTEKQAANGVAELNASGVIISSQLPASVLQYQSTWNATTNTPTLADGTGTAGYVYVVSVAGTQDLGSGNISYIIGDWVIHNGSIWEKVPNSTLVTSVNGATGAVTVAVHDAVTIDTANGLSLSTQALSLAIATGSIPGALQATDWARFDMAYGWGDHSVAGYWVPGTTISSNTVGTIGTFTMANSAGIGGTGLGSKIVFTLENSASAQADSMSIQNSWADGVNGTEDSNFGLSLSRAGSMVEAYTIEDFEHEWYYSSTANLKLDSSAIYPSITKANTLGTGSLYFGDAYVDALYIGASTAQIRNTAGELEFYDSSVATWLTLGDLNSGGSGDVSIYGTPADNQLAVWKTSSSIEGVSDLTWNGNVLNITAADPIVSITDTDSSAVTTMAFNTVDKFSINSSTGITINAGGTTSASNPRLDFTSTWLTGLGETYWITVDASDHDMDFGVDGVRRMSLTDSTLNCDVDIKANNAYLIYNSDYAITKIGDDMVFTDVTNAGGYTLSQLAGGGSTGLINEVGVYSATNTMGGDSTFTWDGTDMFVGASTDSLNLELDSTNNNVNIQAAYSADAYPFTGVGDSDSSKPDTHGLKIRIDDGTTTESEVGRYSSLQFNTANGDGNNNCWGGMSLVSTQVGGNHGRFSWYIRGSSSYYEVMDIDSAGDLEIAGDLTAGNVLFNGDANASIDIDGTDGRDLLISAGTGTGATQGGDLLLMPGTNASGAEGELYLNYYSGDSAANAIKAYTNQTSSSTKYIMRWRLLGSPNTDVAQLRTDGDFWAKDFILYSDPRLKNIKGSVVNGLEIVEGLNPIEYTWKDKQDEYSHIGFSTEEVKQIRPELVKEGEEYDSLSYSRITAINTAAIKELLKRIEELENKLQ
jgi:hypothetical protein